MDADKAKIRELERKVKKYEEVLDWLLRTFENLECDCFYEVKTHYRAHSDHCPIFVTGFINKALAKSHPK